MMCKIYIMLLCRQRTSGGSDKGDMQCNAIEYASMQVGLMNEQMMIWTFPI